MHAREGLEWLAFLEANGIPFAIRVKASMIVNTEGGRHLSLKSALTKCRAARKFQATFPARGDVEALTLTFAAKRVKGGEVLVVASDVELPTRLMARLHLLKHMKGLSDEETCAAWLENPYFQVFCGETHFQHRLPFDRSSMTRWRQRIGAGDLEALLAETIAVAVKTEAVSERQLERITVDTTVQTKAVAHPTDSHLILRAVEWLNRLAKRHGISLRHPPAASVSDEPSRERHVEPNARGGIVRDCPEQVVDFVEAPFGRREIALGDLEDMVEYSHHVAPDERMANLAHGHPCPLDGVWRSSARRARASPVTSESSPTGSHWSIGRASRRSTSAASKVACACRAALARTISPETAALMLGYSPASTRAWA